MYLVAAIIVDDLAGKQILTTPAHQKCYNKTQQMFSLAPEKSLRAVTHTRGDA
jgi:hypothetical protein